MNHLKLPGLIAVAAMAIMALFGAGTASATVLCKTATGGLECGGAWKYSGTIKGSLASGTSAVMKSTTGETLNTCTGGAAEGSASAGGATSTVTGSTSSVSLSSCTNATVTNTSKCEGEIHSISGTSNGTATVKGCQFTANTGILGSCVYGPAETDVGVIEEGGSGEAVKVSKVVKEISGVCPSTMIIEASVVRTSPEGTLGVAPS